MNRINFEEAKMVKLTYINPIGMPVTVKKEMTKEEILEALKDGKTSIKKVIA